MEFKQTISKFVYRIEAKPEGGFIARSSDPSVTPIEGSTRAEVEQKVQASISAALGQQFPALKAVLEKQGIKTTYHVDAKPGGGFVINSSDPAHEPIEAASLEKIEHFINSKFFSYLMSKMPPELSQQLASQLSSGGLNVVVNRKFTVTTGSGTRTPFSTESGSSSSLNVDSAPSREEFLQPSPSSTDGSPVIRYEKGGLGRFFAILLALVAVAGTLYVLLHR